MTVSINRDIASILGRTKAAIPKAFAQFNGDATVAIHKSVNVSSMTDAATGFYDTNVTSNMSDTDYIVSNNGNDNATAAVAF